MASSSRPLSLILPLVVLFLSFCHTVSAIKFNLPAFRYPPQKCIWNPAHPNALVIVTANVGPGLHQRVDIEIVDSSPKRNIYLSKRGIKAESRLAITTHSEGEVGVCLRNYIDTDAKLSQDEQGKLSRVIDLDIDIGADAVDYNAIANQESLSGLETEMRKLEGLVKEVVDEMNYLKKREERFTKTNFSTNKRVQNFAWFSIISLAGLGAWQIFHLRSYFKRKYLID
ncbi:Endoplasmic reticulum vesicle protein 25 [Psilocybe cubensis]|uniref:Endoplasmic reticulum vesicle protein 25 n=2 Tax=Psilocybe cubensis TaxID=181762 RepID=A0ACB8GS54_PSICU|nr:Endoplasmic reticulum vesicle protein 25 [Psilocybe cubensis]KAH9478491.1 Endoplasmic reticulum vesicle protein 25 [Psilocybe cubensis]